MIRITGAVRTVQANPVASVNQLPIALVAQADARSLRTMDRGPEADRRVVVQLHAKSGSAESR